MFNKMIRSARTRLVREHGSDDIATSANGSSTDRVVHSASDGSAQPASVRWRTELRAMQAEGGENQANESRPLKRMGAARAVVGVAQQRLTRSKSTTSHGSENAPVGQVPPVPHASSAAVSVLGDVTNTAGGQIQQGLPKSGAFATKAPHAASIPHDPTKSSVTVASAPVAATSVVEAVPAARADPNPHETRPPLVPAPADVDVDMAHKDDPQHVVEYTADIYRLMQQEDAKLLQFDYMDKQPQVNSKMRAMLCDWLVDVHKKYKLRPETLYLAVFLLDRFLEKRVTQQRHLQLVGITALLVAAKFEEIYPPQIHEMVYVTDKAYTKEEVLRMEVSMLNELDFKICRPTAVHFLDRYQRVNGCSDCHRDLACYLLELTLVEYKMNRYLPSQLAAASILLSNKLLRRQPSWSAANVRHTKMTEQGLKECAKEICTLLVSAETSTLQAVRKKYSQTKYHTVAKLNFAAARTLSSPTATSSTAASVSVNQGQPPLRVAAAVEQISAGAAAPSVPANLLAAATAATASFAAPRMMPGQVVPPGMSALAQAAAAAADADAAAAKMRRGSLGSGRPHETCI